MHQTVFAILSGHSGQAFRRAADAQRRVRDIEVMNIR
jgi:hypothetical protein